MSSTEDLLKFSRQKIDRGSKSFAAASRLFAPQTRASAHMLYAWCRHCDDVIDGQAMGFPNGQEEALSGDRALQTVNELEAKTRNACIGIADERVFEALSVVCDRHAIDERYPLDLIQGFRMDAEERNYDTIDDTLLYCYHVAGVVGVMMAMVMGVKQRAVLNRACDLGIALQLTNIARDVIPDHRTGRIYLPRDWLEEAGLSHETMCAEHNRPALFSVTRRLLDTAEPYYRSATHGLPHLSWRSAWAVSSAQKVYRAIGIEVRRRGAEAWDSRVSTTKPTKLASIMSGLAQTLVTRIPGTELDVCNRSGLWTMPD